MGKKGKHMGETYSVDNEIGQDEPEPKYAILVKDLKSELKKMKDPGPAASVLGMRIRDYEGIGLVVEGFTGGMSFNIPIEFHSIIKEGLSQLGYTNIEIRNDRYPSEPLTFYPMDKTTPVQTPDYFGTGINESTGKKHNPDARAMDK